MFKTRPPLDILKIRRRSIVVSLSEHKISIKADGTLVKEITEFSAGRSSHLTQLVHQGKLDPVRRERMHYSDTYYDSLGNPAAMPFALFFGDGSSCAFHAGDPHRETFGSIQLMCSDAEWLFKWAVQEKLNKELLASTSKPPI